LCFRLKNIFKNLSIPSTLTETLGLIVIENLSLILIIAEYLKAADIFILPVLNFMTEKV
jgi:hypothetical protein